tara:strand:- start:525 stop:1073 length:549 start_codon:yes stop_codon:yes gene_type:complete
MKIVENNGYVQQLESPPPSPPPEPTEDEVKTTKRRKKLSDKQLVALQKGRERVQENKIKRERERSNYRKKKASATARDVDTEFINAGLSAKKEAKNLKKHLIAFEPSVSKEKEIRKKLQKKKNNQMRIKSWQSLREETLEQCDSVEDFDELSSHLDTITEEDIYDESMLTNKLNKIFDNYKK